MPLDGHRRRLQGFVLLYAITAFVILGALQAQASAFSNLSYKLAETLGITQAIAELMLGGGVILAIGLALALLRLDIMGIAIVMLASIAVLVGIGWLDVWLLILAALITALMLAARFKVIFSSGGG